jgi:hypothetical protein
MDSLPDRRAVAFPDEPYSAYCKVCWQCVYPLWIDKEDHHRGECMVGASKMEDCKQAMEWAQCVGKIRSYVKASRRTNPVT